MAKINIIDRCPTVDAIYAEYEKRQGDGRRVHLGGSLLGKECERALFYSFRWASQVQHAGRLLRLFQSGHLQEPRLIEDLRATGITVYEVDESTGEQFTVSACNGHAGGSMDGIAIGIHAAPKSWHLLEFKTSNAKGFRELQNKGLQAAKPQHYSQMQFYLGLSGLERGFYMAVNKDDDNIYTERVYPDPDEFARLMARAERVINAQSPPARLSNDPSFFLCKRCEHKSICHEGGQPERNCRTCLSVTVADHGMWFCERHGNTLETREQKRGCPDQRFLPGLVPGDQIDTDADGLLISYRMKDGSEWVDDGP